MAKFFNENFTDFVDIEPIMDSIYEIIKISPFEKRLLNTKEMQRLRGIKQLGFVSLVYPDAEHSRFSHSIGVCHQSKILMNHVCSNISSKQEYKEWRTDYEKDKLIDPKLLEITEVEKIVIAAAALLHDLSHSPFSHEIESSNPDKKGIPVHDDFKNNHIFYSYLFDCEKSDLANIIRIYNKSFWEKAKGDKKWGIILQNDENKKRININTGNVIIDTEELPILGVMIFEIMLFDKMEHWLQEKKEEGEHEQKEEGVDLEQNKEGEFSPNNDGIKVCINENKDKIIWKKIEGWFRPYRKDIIANTICADLLDYLLRDGRNTGILSSLDLKFLDRIAISKAIPERTKEKRILLSKIPEFCEHIVFDIYDHKRGVIRQSVITEIISFLQQRYLLTERVYEHRVVEGARSMLQQTVKLLIAISNVFCLEKLHDVNANGNSPINDEAFFSWVLNLDESQHYDIKKAKRLVRMLRDRRIFREIVIIDGISVDNKGSLRGIDLSCKTLESVVKKNQETINEALNTELLQFIESKDFKIENTELDEPEKNALLKFVKEEIVFTMGVRQYDRRYKIPRVLVALPTTNKNDNETGHDNLETLPLFDAEIPDIKSRLESMEGAYKRLWKVYLFIHPHFHDRKFADLNLHMSKKFIKILNDKTKMNWSNSIEKYEHLLPKDAIDVRSFIKSNPIFLDNSKSIVKFVKMINKKIPIGNYNITNERFEKILNEKPYNRVYKDLSLQNKFYNIFEDEGFTFKLEIAASDQNEAAIINQIYTILKNLLNEKKDQQKSKDKETGSIPFEK